MARGVGSRPRPHRAGQVAGVDRTARAFVEAQRLHDLERGGPGELLDVGGGQHAGVLGDHGRGGPFGDGVEVAFDAGPGVHPGLHVVGDWVDAGQGFSGAGFDVGDVLLVHGDVVPGGEPAQVPADEVGPGVGQGDVGSLHVPLHVLAEVDVVDRYPAGVDDIDEHQGVVVGEVDVDVVGGVVGAVEGQLDALAAGLQGVGVGEGHVGQRPGRVAGADQEPAGFLVADPGDVPVEQRGGAAVVGVVVGVDQVGHGVGHAVGGGDLVHGPLQVTADARRRVEQHHAVRGGQERRLVDAVGHVVQVPLHASDVVALVVEGRAERGPGDRRVVGLAVAGCW